MARQRSKARIITVEPVDRNDNDHILTYEESETSKTTIDNGEQRKSKGSRDLMVNSHKDTDLDLPADVITVKPVDIITVKPATTSHDEVHFYNLFILIILQMF